MQVLLRNFFISVCSLLLFVTVIPGTTFAAEVRGNETIDIPSTENNLHDLYLFGQTVSIDAPVTNDLVVAGGNISVTNAVSGDLLAAGGTIQIKGPVANTARIAGGTILVNNSIGRDLVIAGGQITTGKNAAVKGDVLITGGNVHISGPVDGKIQLHGGEAVIDAPVRGDISGNVNKLTLGSHAKISGNLTYTAPTQVVIERGANVSGKTTFNKVQQHHNRAGTAALFGSLTIYKLLTDIVLSILLIYFLRRYFTRIAQSMGTDPVKCGAIGFIFFILFPLAALICVILFWLGLAGFLLYGLIVLLGIFTVKIFLGWAIMRWYEMREKREYVLDWRAGIIGPLVLFIVFLVPFVGWLAAAILFFIALGSILLDMQAVLSNQSVTKPVKKK